VKKTNIIAFFSTNFTENDENNENNDTLILLYELYKLFKINVLFNVDRNYKTIDVMEYYSQKNRSSRHS